MEDGDAADVNALSRSPEMLLSFKPLLEALANSDPVKAASYVVDTDGNKVFEDAETAISVFRKLDAVQKNGGGLDDATIKALGLDPEMLNKAKANVEAGIQQAAYDAVSRDPFTNMPKLASLWLRYKGYDSLADMAGTPWIFYGGIVTLLGGGTLLLGSLFSGDDEDEEDSEDAEEKASDGGMYVNAV